MEQLKWHEFSTEFFRECSFDLIKEVNSTMTSDLWMRMLTELTRIVQRKVSDAYKRGYYAACEENVSWQEED